MASNVDVKSAVRVVQIFQLFADIQRPASLAFISTRMGMPKSSCQALLRTLEAHGYLNHRDESKDYYPTRRLYDETRTIVEQDPLLKDLRPLLRALRDATGETVFLARRDGLQSHYMEVVEGGQTLRFAGVAGERRPLYIGAAGHSLLGGMERAERSALIATIQFERFSPKTITNATTLLRHVNEGVKRGWFMSIGAYEVEVSSIGGFIRLNGETYAIVVAAPTQRIERNQKIISRLVVDLCSSVTQG
ncbi:helix-turn-helix domain-containing protein [soil metagenome]